MATTGYRAALYAVYTEPVMGYGRNNNQNTNPNPDADSIPNPTNGHILPYALHNMS